MSAHRQEMPRETMVPMPGDVYDAVARAPRTCEASAKNLVNGLLAKIKKHPHARGERAELLVSAGVLTIAAAIMTEMAREAKS